MRIQVGNSLAVRIPDLQVKALRLKQGDSIEIVIKGDPPARSTVIARGASDGEVACTSRRRRLASDSIGMPRMRDGFVHHRHQHPDPYAFRRATIARRAPRRRWSAVASLVSRCRMNSPASRCKPREPTSERSLGVIEELLAAELLTNAVHARAVASRHGQSFYDAFDCRRGAGNVAAGFWRGDFQHFDVRRPGWSAIRSGGSAAPRWLTRGTERGPVISASGITESAGDFAWLSRYRRRYFCRT